MGKSTISMAIFNSFLYVYQRVALTNHRKLPFFSPIKITMKFHIASLKAAARFSVAPCPSLEGSWKIPPADGPLKNREGGYPKMKNGG
jgi:hypothetical protein